MDPKIKPVDIDIVATWSEVHHAYMMDGMGKDGKADAHYDERWDCPTTRHLFRGITKERPRRFNILITPLDED